MRGGGVAGAIGEGRVWNSDRRGRGSAAEPRVGPQPLLPRRKAVGPLKLGQGDAGAVRRRHAGPIAILMRCWRGKQGKRTAGNPPQCARAWRLTCATGTGERTLQGAKCPA